MFGPPGTVYSGIRSIGLPCSQYCCSRDPHLRLVVLLCDFDDFEAEARVEQLRQGTWEVEQCVHLGESVSGMGYSVSRMP